jgi:hypothetical protein
MVLEGFTQFVFLDCHLNNKKGNDKPETARAAGQLTKVFPVVKFVIDE